MDKTTKLFLWTAISAGLPFGLFMGLFQAIAEDWRWSLGSGIFSGVLFGLAMAYFNVRQLSRQIHPIEILQTSKEEANLEDLDEEFMFPAEMKSNRRFIYPFTGLAVILAIPAFLLSRNPDTLIQWTILIIFILLEWIFLFVAQNVMHLSLSHEGIVLQNLLSRLSIHWEDVERIEMRGQFWFEQYWYLICKNSEIKANAFTKWWMKSLERDQRIPLMNYSNDFLKSDIPNAILHFAPHLKFYTTS